MDLNKNKCKDGKTYQELVNNAKTNLMPFHNCVNLLKHKEDINIFNDIDFLVDGDLKEIRYESTHVLLVIMTNKISKTEQLLDIRVPFKYFQTIFKNGIGKNMRVQIKAKLKKVKNEYGNKYNYLNMYTLYFQELLDYSFNLKFPYYTCNGDFSKEYCSMEGYNFMTSKKDGKCPYCGSTLRVVYNLYDKEYNAEIELLNNI